MSNEQRQKSLVKKNGMTGVEDYCGQCPASMAEPCFNGELIEFYSCCVGRVEDNPCAKAYNRMMRIRSKK